ncbi:MAG: hypothetical protein R6V59_03345 [Dehalococcoidia bacterium]
MQKILACEFDPDRDTGTSLAIKASVTLTEETRFVHAITKNISGRQLRRVPYAAHVVPMQKRRIPFRNMVYTGTGLSDIPSFSPVAINGGDGVGVADKPVREYESAKGGRMTTGSHSANYQRGCDMKRALEVAVLDKAWGIHLDLQRAVRRGSTG